jgi:hypothetical protein
VGGEHAEVAQLVATRRRDDRGEAAEEREGREGELGGATRRRALGTPPELAVGKAGEARRVERRPA